VQKMKMKMIGVLAYGAAAVSLWAGSHGSAFAEFGPRVCSFVGPGVAWRSVSCEKNGPYGLSVGNATVYQNIDGWASLHANHVSGPGSIEAKAMYQNPFPKYVSDYGQNDGSTSISWGAGGFLNSVCCRADDGVIIN